MFLFVLIFLVLSSHRGMSSRDWSSLSWANGLIETGLVEHHSELGALKETPEARKRMSGGALPVGGEI